MLHIFITTHFSITAILKRGSDELTKIIKELKPVRKQQLLKCAATWNTNSRNSQVAQV